MATMGTGMVGVAMVGMLLYFAECRAALSKLPEADRGREVERAIAEHDDAYASAALGGSTRLTGLGVAQQAALLAVWRRNDFRR
jgi:hypothetical protein